MVGQTPPPPTHYTLAWLLDYHTGKGAQTAQVDSRDPTEALTAGVRNEVPFCSSERAETHSLRDFNLPFDTKLTPRLNYSRQSISCPFSSTCGNPKLDKPIRRPNGCMTVAKIRSVNVWFVGVRKKRAESHLCHVFHKAAVLGSATNAVVPRVLKDTEQ